MTIDVIVALNNEETSQKIKSILVGNGFNVIAVCKYGNELIRSIKQLSPSIVICGYKFKDMNLLNIFESTGDDCSFLAIVNEPYKSIIQEETDIICISSPINTMVLLNTLDIIYQSERKINRLKKKVNNLELKINERIIIEKAKGLLMYKKGLSEDEAYRYIQKNSMDSGLRMVEYAKKFIS